MSDWKVSHQGSIKNWKSGPKSVSADASGVMAILSTRRCHYWREPSDIMAALALMNDEDRPPCLEAWAHHLAAREEAEREPVPVVEEREPLKRSEFVRDSRGWGVSR